MLTLDQSREYTRFKKLSIFFETNGSVISAYPPFHAEVNSFNDNLNRLETLIPQKDGKRTGITTSKTTLKHSVADRLAVICTTTKAYALKFNNQQLAAEVNFRANEMFRLKDADFLPFVLHMQELITPLLTDANYIPYGVTIESVVAIVADAQNFNDFIGVADVQASGNSVANKNIDAAIRLLLGNIVQFDLLIEYFTASNPGFAAGYHINSTLDNTSIRHSGIEGVVMANGEPVAGAVIKLANGKSVVTDLYGHYSLVRVAPGDYSIEVSANGFPAKTIVYHISRGKVGALNVELHSAA